MPKKTPLPYLSKTPWAGFTSRQRPRQHALAACPSPACRRAKACIAAHDGLYCQRSHLGLGEIRHKNGQPPPAPVTPRSKPMTLRQVRVLGDITQLQLEDIAARNAEMTKRWQSGEFDGLYGKYDAKGVLMHPPERRYVGK